MFGNKVLPIQYSYLIEKKNKVRLTFKQSNSLAILDSTNQIIIEAFSLNFNWIKWIFNPNKKTTFL